MGIVVAECKEPFSAPDLVVLKHSDKGRIGDLEGKLISEKYPLSLRAKAGGCNCSASRQHLDSRCCFVLLSFMLCWVTREKARTQGRSRLVLDFDLV